MSRTLLLEIGTEELPAEVIPNALRQLEEVARGELAKARISYGALRTGGTPRRLALIVEDVAERQRTAQEEVKGPSVQVAFDKDGKPGPAAQGFARKQGVDVRSLERRVTPQGEYVFAVRKEEGRAVSDVLAELLPHWVRALQFPATMRWGSGKMRFSRPIRWLVTLLGAEVIPWQLDGLTAGRTTRGRRFSGVDEVEIREAEEYEATLRQAHVEVDPAARRAQVWDAVSRAAREVGGAPLPDEQLLEEVVFLIEEPGVVRGHVKETYLNLPDPVLVTPMKEHQRYFPVVDSEGRLMPHFVTVINGDHGDRALIREGNEKVLDARLSDARFFFEEDLKTNLEDRVDALKSVLFQERLGNLYEKVARVGSLVRLLGEEAGVEEERIRSAERVAKLSKADLVTHMVYEFPELQGVMGREYALRQGEDERVAEGVLEHLMPRGATDDLPGSTEGVLVGLADKLDTLVGCFGAGLIPTGSQDPYALRRQALGVIRILLSDEGKALHLSLDRAIAHASAQYRVDGGDSEWAKGRERLHEFFAQRMRGVLLEKGFHHDAVDAVLSGPAGEVSEVFNRVQTLDRIRSDRAFADLVALFQRAANLVDRHGAAETPEDAQKGVSAVLSACDPSRLEEDEEKALYTVLQEAAREVESLYEVHDYETAVHRLADLRPSVDRFFDSVLVMAPDPEVRKNRLALLSVIVGLAAPLADLRKIEVIADS